MSNVKIYWVLTAIMFVWGLNVSLVKILVANFDPITITSLRILTAGMCVFVILACLKEVRRPSGSEWGYILAGSLLNVVGHHYFLAEGLRETSAVNGGLILGLGPLLTALLSMFFLRRKPSYIRLSGFLLGGLGVGFTVLSGGKGLNEITSGDFYIFLSIFSQASSFILISKAVKTINPRLLTGYMLVLGSIILFVISLITEPNGIASL
ncbi:MAG TPA: DMT family transporter, partial [Chondromyces sp.]|nr:DMT family transporter [Chondromyces sp.]